MARLIENTLIAGTRPLVVVLLFASAVWAAPPSPSPGGSNAPFSADDVVASLGQALAWYQQARATMRAINTTADPLFAREDQETVLRLLQRAFDAAHAKSALLNQAKSLPANPGPEGQPPDERARLEADIAHDQQEVERLRLRIRQAPARSRAPLEREQVAAQHRLELGRLRLDFITRLQQLGSSLSSTDEDLDHRIQALQDGVPELHSPESAAQAGTPSAATASGSWGQIHRVVALQHDHAQLDELANTTNGLIRRVDGELHAAEAMVRPIVGRLRDLTKDPGPAGASLADGEREFRQQLERAKLLGGVVLPLREQSALLHRYAGVLTDAQRAIGRASVQSLEALAVQLGGVFLSIAGILVGGVVWRVAATRYVVDAYRRRLLMGARNVVVVVAIVLVVVFHFTTELAALVTALGFAAAGIAFALQNVILSIAGYFSMVSPQGIRVGDRVSLQGPFQYVQGEVAEIGLLRIKLEELAGEPPAPTGRIVIFPNSVVFTGSFFKQSAS
jgi:hypothetical protein